MVDKRKMKCRLCGNSAGMIRKYRLNICRRCFKDYAKKLGFRKYE